MKTQDITTGLTTAVSAKEVQQKISQVPNWWGIKFEGNAEKKGDHFIIRMGPEAYFNCTVTELVPGKRIVWSVAECFMPWYTDKQEWTNTRMIFDLEEKNEATHLTFTHEGLTPDVECYKDCKPGWTHWITRSLFSYLTTGQGDFQQR